MTRRIVLILALLVAGPALAQKPSGGAPEVQSAAPEVGAGRGGANNSQQPRTTEPQPGTGQPRSPAPEDIAPRPAVPVAPITAPPPFTARGGADAAAVEAAEARSLGMVQGLVSIPNQAAGVLIQPKGRDWRGWRTTVLTIAGGAIVLGVIGILAGLYLWKGPQPIEAGRSGHSIARYTLLERLNHWMVATSFVILGLSGLNLTFGVYALRPLIGPEAFTAVTWWGQAARRRRAAARPAAPRSTHARRRRNRWWWMRCVTGRMSTTSTASRLAAATRRRAGRTAGRRCWRRLRWTRWYGGRSQRF